MVYLPCRSMLLTAVLHQFNQSMSLLSLIDIVTKKETNSFSCYCWTETMETLLVADAKWVDVLPSKEAGSAVCISVLEVEIGDAWPCTPFTALNSMRILSQQGRFQ